MGMFILCLLTGYLGVHKFVEGKVSMGLLYLFTGGLCGIGWIVDCVKYYKAAKVKSEPVTVSPAVTPVERPVTVSPAAVEVESEPVSPEEYERMLNMCKDIHSEYKDLFKKYSGSDTDGKVYILKECYRKLSVIETTVNKYKCYYDIDVYEEYEKIEKKARSFINAYIKEEREAGNDDYMIDVIQFTDDLEFISDYIYEKDEKLNRDTI